MRLRQEGWGATKALCPMRRVLGPPLPPAGTEEANIMREKYEERSEAPGQAYHRLQGRRLVPAPEESQARLIAQDFPGFVFNTPEGFQLGNGRYDQEGLAKEYALLHVRSLVFVHFFSGYRREHDLHHQLEHRCIEPGLEIFVISVDLCLQREQGNLVSPTAHAFWVDRIKSGQVIGAGGGPPCETYSAARQQSGGPRALRSEEFPWGLPSLRPKEWKQVLVGTRLLHFLLDIILLLAQVGGCGFCEHPQFPTWLLERGPASIWAHPAVRALRLLRCCGITSFDQCSFGAPAVKPTTVMHLRLPGFRHRVMLRGNCGRCQHGKGAHEQLKGLAADGTFRTARCKVYPAALNAALAEAIFDFAQRTFAGSAVGREIAPELLAFSHSDFVAQDQVQPDYYEHCTGVR